MRFDGKVAVVTGAGNGLGRSHALLLAARGAKILVNDLGTSTGGEGQTAKPADAVVSEIRKSGGEAVASYNSVTEGSRIIEAALDSFGRVDIVINNAGVLRDASFKKMTDEDWDLVYRVHGDGAHKVTRAAWPHFLSQNYGRVIFTSSAAGLYGNFGQSNYSFAKLGLFGLAQTLAIEGRSKNINANVIAPVAGSRMTDTILPKEVSQALSHDAVSSLVAFLSHESCIETGGLFECGGGWIAKLRWQRALGASFGRVTTIEDIVREWEKIGDYAAAEYPTDLNDTFERLAQVTSLPMTWPSR